MLTKYEENLLKAQNEDKVKFYDYNVYKKRAKKKNDSSSIQKSKYIMLNF